MARYRYDTGFVTHAGNRRAANQDSLLLRRGSLGSQDFLLLAVADGMGGMARGELASGCATELLDGWWASELPALLGPAGPDWPGLESSLTVAVERINAAIRQRGADRPDQAGTTLTALFLFGAEYLILHTGDSRAYRLWDGPPLQLTRDHTWCAREQAAGRLTPEQAASHPMRHMLTSTLGVRESYELDRLRGALRPGSGVLLCSDGFYQEIGPDRLPARAPASAQRLLDRLLRQALAGEAGDNLTALLVRVARRWR